MTSFRSFSMIACLMIPFTLAGMVTAPDSARAQDGEVIGESGQWTAFRSGSGDNQICFITSEPTQLEGNYDRNNRGETRVFVTHHGPDAEDRSVVSSVAGYRFKEGEEVVFDVDGRKYTLFSVDTRAWATKPSQDAELTTAMKRGNRLKVTGVSSRGNKTIDTYSLTGFTRALGIIDQACP